MRLSQFGTKFCIAMKSYARSKEIKEEILMKKVFLTMKKLHNKDKMQSKDWLKKHGDLNIVDYKRFSLSAD